MKKFAFLLSLGCIAFAPAAQAQESVVRAQTETPKNGPIQKWLDAENALVDPLSDKDKESFFILRNKHSIIRVIRIVERDIENAVKACGKANPEIKDSMSERFEQWQKAVNPIIDTARKQLDRDLSAQKFVSTKEAKKVLKLNDEAYEHGEKQIVKTPVTSKDACQSLISSMDRTEDEMIGLLRETLLPESVIRDRAEKAEEQQETEQKPAPAKKSFARPTRNQPQQSEAEPQTENKAEEASAEKPAAKKE